MPDLFLKAIDIFFWILQFNWYFLLDITDKICEMLVYNRQNFFLISLGSYLHFLIIIFNCVLKNHLIIVLFPLFVGEMVNIDPHR